ncbi:hypothetical protein K493DRAFT_341167 [Basidiobolus meristosporus CBS 931.73]|uniref:Uncharacterized protein n=1 Tax=Basidiobolus meristosporus CBS 931.73 TaxID=1314790 RepID=A0A1Y1XTI0_9FUNG|nr:hypothetical protein K493DRAFT_341167 [Basidiobolus meristosporus CBS 931.73]|eukprot:ORX88604.1 hypothetical protein K493DRAFT_341167 [Basidiobolus meristosporus CBS 931.73]
MYHINVLLMAKRLFTKRLSGVMAGFIHGYLVYIAILSSLNSFHDLEAMSSKPFLLTLTVGEENYYLSSVWEKHVGKATALTVTLTNCKVFWKKSVSVEELLTVKPSYMDVEDYLSLTEQTFSGLPNEHNEEVCCTIEDSYGGGVRDSSKILKWSLALEKGNKFALGHLDLVPLKEQATVAEWSNWLKLWRDEQEENMRIRKDLNVLQNTNHLLHQQLDALVKEKDDMELLMVHKFKDLLNSKKRKIKKLMKVRVVSTETSDSSIASKPPDEVVKIQARTKSKRVGQHSPAISSIDSKCHINRTLTGCSQDQRGVVSLSAGKSRHPNPNDILQDTTHDEKIAEHPSSRTKKSSPPLHSDKPHTDSSPILDSHSFRASKARIQTSIQRLLNFDDSPTKEPESLKPTRTRAKQTPPKRPSSGPADTSPDLFAASRPDTSPDLFPKRKDPAMSTNPAPKRKHSAISADLSPELFPKRTKTPISFRSYARTILHSP